MLWEFGNTDLPGVTITNMTGLHLLPNGHVAVGVSAAYRDGEGTGLFEITRDRKLVWRYSNPAREQVDDGRTMCLTPKYSSAAGKMYALTSGLSEKWIEATRLRKAPSGHRTGTA